MAVHSQLEEGTIVQVYLPISDQVSVSVPEIEEEVPGGKEFYLLMMNGAR